MAGGPKIFRRMRVAATNAGVRLPRGPARGCRWGGGTAHDGGEEEATGEIHSDSRDAMHNLHLQASAIRTPAAI